MKRTFSDLQPQQITQRPDGSYLLCYDIKQVQANPPMQAGGYKYYEHVFEEKPTKKMLIDVMIKAKYDHDDEIAVINNKDEKPEEYAVYKQYRQTIKQKVTEILLLI